VLNKTNPEQAGWMGETINERHKRWGRDFLIMGFDWLVMDSDDENPIALIEYKHQDEILQGCTPSTYKALIKLGDGADLPVFSVRYADDFEWWKVTPLNQIAKGFIPDMTVMNEYSYVIFLYQISNRKVPFSVKERLIFRNR